MRVEVADNLTSRGRVDLGFPIRRPLPTTPGEVRGFIGGGKIPPRRPTGFFGVGGVFPGDDRFESLETPELVKAAFLAIWAEGLPNVRTSVKSLHADLESLLKKTAISEYGQFYLRHVAVSALLQGRAPEKSLPAELLVMEETFDQRRRSQKAELNLLDHLIGHEKFLKSEVDLTLREDMIEEWTKELLG